MVNKMSVNGIWQIELLGAYGWEAVSMAFLEDGIYKAASHDHYSIGHYEVSESKIMVTAHHVSYSQTRTLFGAKNKEINVSFEGEVKGDQITGQATDDRAKFLTTFRATRLAGLP